MHTFLNLIKQDKVTNSQWKIYCWKTMIQCKKTSLLVYFLWSYISAEGPEKCELESTFNEIIKKSCEALKCIRHMKCSDGCLENCPRGKLPPGQGQGLV